MSDPTLFFEVFSQRLLIAVYGDGAPSTAAWADYLGAIEGMGDEIYVLAFSSGGGPTLMQRRQLEEALGDRGGRAAIVTTSRIARGIVTAIRWFNRDIKSFSPSEWKDALEFMQLSADDGARVMQRLSAMADQIGNSEELGLA
jgi:hypothetical protein